jgi:hypothetical protein
MRKTCSSLLIFGLLLGGVVKQTQAQDKKLEFNLNVGVLKGVYSTIFTIGSGLDYQLGKYLMISPEIQLWRAPDVLVLFPGTVVNLEFKNFFVGGGAVIGFRISGDENLEMDRVSAKINTGIKFNRIKLTLYLLTSFEGIFLSFDNVQFGGSIGIVI